MGHGHGHGTQPPDPALQGLKGSEGAEVIKLHSKGSLTIPITGIERV